MLRYLCLSLAFIMVLNISGFSAWFEEEENFGVNDNDGGRYVAWGDINNDGFEDLFVGNAMNALVNNFRLFLNDQGQGFIDITADCGINLEYACFCGVWGDYDNDGFLDIYICQGEYSIDCPAPDKLYRNVGDMVTPRFEETTYEAFGTDVNTGIGSSAAWGDLNNDGWLDLRGWQTSSFLQIRRTANKALAHREVRQPRSVS